MPEITPNELRTHMCVVISVLERVVVSDGKLKINSATHPAAYKEITRLAKRPKEFPVQLADEFTTNRANLFTLFVEQGRDLQKVTEAYQ